MTKNHKLVRLIIAAIAAIAGIYFFSKNDTVAGFIGLGLAVIFVVLAFRDNSNDRNRRNKNVINYM